MNATIDKDYMIYLMLLGKVSEAKEMIKATNDLIINGALGITGEFGSISDINKAITYNLEAVNANLCGISGMIELLDMIATVTKDDGYEANANKLRHDFAKLVYEYEKLYRAHNTPVFIFF